jgi:biotin synthase
LHELPAGEGTLPERIRASLGSAIVLGLLRGKLDAAPTTAYLMTYRPGKCAANCGFCPQARGSQSRADMLSRVSWPDFATGDVLEAIAEAAREGKIKRVCIQALNYPEVFTHLVALLRAIRERANVSASVSCQPVNKERMKQLARAGAERIGIPLDAATEEVFDRVKGVFVGGSYRWKEQFELLGEAVEIFGKGKVSTHLIVGLGESEKQMVQAIQRCVDMGVLPALFAFTPIRGTALENVSPPAVKKYRRVQVARQFIVVGLAKSEDMAFDNEGNLTDFGVDRPTLIQTIWKSECFLTSGCPSCNRPYYNEKPGGPIYNFPKVPTDDDVRLIEKDLAIEHGEKS